MHAWFRFHTVPRVHFINALHQNLVTLIIKEHQRKCFSFPDIQPVNNAQQEVDSCLLIFYHRNLRLQKYRPSLDVVLPSQHVQLPGRKFIHTVLEIPWMIKRIFFYQGWISEPRGDLLRIWPEPLVELRHCCAYYGLCHQASGARLCFVSWCLATVKKLIKGKESHFQKKKLWSK